MIAATAILLALSIVLYFALWRLGGKRRLVIATLFFFLLLAAFIGLLIFVGDPAPEGARTVIPEELGDAPD